MKIRYVLQNKKRFFICIFSVLTLIFSMVLSDKVYSSNEKSYEFITVHQGDTLWDIAREHNQGGDIRKYIFNLKKLNGLEGSDIYPGDRIKIPVQ